MIVDDDTLKSFQKHFRLLRSDGDPINFLSPRNKKSDVSVVNTKSLNQKFIEALFVAEQTFNVTDDYFKERLEYEFVAYEKSLPYVGNQTYLSLFESNGKITNKQKYLNALAVFPSAETLHLPKSNTSHSMHGALGFNREV